MKRDGFNDIAVRKALGGFYDIAQAYLGMMWHCPEPLHG
jgi:hypothetical protein